MLCEERVRATTINASIAQALLLNEIPIPEVGIDLRNYFLDIQYQVALDGITQHIFTCVDNFSEARRRKWLQGNPESSNNDDPVVFDTSIIPWWAWMKRFHLPEAELLNGRAAMIGFFMAYLVDSLTGVGLVDQMGNFFCKTLLFVAVITNRDKDENDRFETLLDQFDLEKIPCPLRNFSHEFYLHRLDTKSQPIYDLISGKVVQGEGSPGECAWREARKRSVSSSTTSHQSPVTTTTTTTMSIISSNKRLQAPHKHGDSVPKPFSSNNYHQSADNVLDYYLFFFMSDDILTQTRKITGSSAIITSSLFLFLKMFHSSLRIEKLNFVSYNNFDSPGWVFHYTCSSYRPEQNYENFISTVSPSPPLSLSSNFLKVALGEDGGGLFCSAPSVFKSETASSSSSKPRYWKVTNPTLSPSHLQDLPGFTRSVYKRDHALITPESHVFSPLPEWTNTLGAYLITPAMGSHFVMYLAKMQENSKSGLPPNDVERFLFVVQGSATLINASGADHQLTVDSYAYLAPNFKHSLECDASATLAVFERRYSPLENHARFLNSEKLLPPSLPYDFNIHIMDFQPGEFLNVKEVHYNQHGLLLLEGQGIYRLADSWYPVQSGDAIWMAPFVPQWYAALGKTRSRYLLYKDVNRNPL
ncbi:hypothetical protein OIU78_014169 [Salix suchowensis]|nr:hypothetical protein OIU78_014169 [Salix suchowensis]